MTRAAERDALIAGLRAQGISDERVLAALAAVPRERFMEKVFEAQAYADQAMPIACGQTISQPYVVAFMTEKLAVEPHHRVLEIGTGSGYQTAILAKLASEVFTIERFPALAETAAHRLKAIKITNVRQRVGDGHDGWPEEAPFDRIMVTAAAQSLPAALAGQLGAGGVMVLPIDETATRQELLRVTESAKGLKTERLLPVRFVPMVKGGVA